MKKIITLIIGVLFSLIYCTAQDYTVFNFENVQPAIMPTPADGFALAANPTKDAVNGSNNAGIYTHTGQWRDVSISTPNIDTRLYSSYEVKCYSPSSTTGQVYVACFGPTGTQLDWFQQNITTAGTWIKFTRNVSFTQKIARVMVSFNRNNAYAGTALDNTVYFDDLIFKKIAGGPDYTLYNEDFAGGYATWQGTQTVTPSSQNGKWLGKVNATTPGDATITLLKSWSLNSRQAELLLAPSAAATAPGPVVTFSGVDLAGFRNLKLNIAANWPNVTAEATDFNNAGLAAALKTPKLEMQSGSGSWVSIPLTALKAEGWSNDIQTFNLSTYALGSGVSTLNFRLTSAPNLTTVFYNMTITGQVPIITWNQDLSTLKTTDSPVTLTATSTVSSASTPVGTDITYTSGNNAVVTVSGSTLTVVAAGTTTVTAKQAANTNYNAAFDVVQNVTVKITPTLSVSGTQSFTYNTTAQGPSTISYSGDATPTKLYTSTDGGGWSSATAPTNAGAYQVVASAIATATYFAATSSAYTFTINKASSSISVTGSTSFNYTGSAQGPATSSVTGSTGAVTYSYSGTGYGPSATAPTAVGSYTVSATVAADNNYNSASSAATGFTIAAVIPNAPTIGTATAGTAQASVAFTAPANNGGSSIIDYTVTSNPGNITVTGASSPIIVTGLTNGTAYTFTVTARNSIGSSLSSSASNSATPAPASVAVSADANLSSYFPSAATDVTVSSGTLTVDANVTVKSLTVNPGAKVTLASGKTLTVVGAFTLQSDATGTATFVDGNLVDNPASVTNVTVQQYLPFIERNWYVSSPVTSSAFGQINRGNSALYYDEQHASSTPWPAASGNLIPGKGYISVASSSTGTGSVSFPTGTLNSGLVTVPLTRTAGQPKEGFNLVGNPYPSYLTWTSGMATAANVLSTIWYRTKSAGSYLFYTYNPVSDVSAPSTAGITAYIPPMQAFWVRVKAANDGSSTTGTLTFNNSMRSHGDGSSNLLKVRSSQKTIQKELRLQVSNGTNSDETVILFNLNASNAFDDYDSPKMSNANAAIPEIYTSVGTDNMVINGLNSFTNNDVIPLGFSPGTASSFSIKAIEVNNFDSGTQILLLDKAKNAIENISTGNSYNFDADNSIPASSRFSIILKTPSVTTDVNSVEDTGITVSTNAQNKITIFCSGNLNNGDYASVYNVIGKKITEKQLKSSITVFDAQFQTGVYFVNAHKGGKTQTIKLIIH
jgi:hypothetical protein